MTSLKVGRLYMKVGSYPFIMTLTQSYSEYLSGRRLVSGKSIFIKDPDYKQFSIGGFTQRA